MEKYQIVSNINSIAKDVLNKMLIERNYIGADYIREKLNGIDLELKKWEFISNNNLKNRLIHSMIKSQIENINTSDLPLDMKTHLANYIRTMGKITVSANLKPKYVVYDPLTMKSKSSESISIRKIKRLCKHLSLQYGKEYAFDTKENYRKLKYEYQKKLYD